MIWTVMQVNARRLMHNRIEILLTFAVPIVFFSIFAVIFGGALGGSIGGSIGSANTPKLNVVGVDETAAASGAPLLQQLQHNPGLRFKRDPLEPLSRDEARRLVRQGVVAIAIIVTGDEHTLRAELLADASNQVAGQVAMALVSRELMLHQAASSSRSAESSPIAQPVETPQSPVTIVDVMGDGKTNPVVSMYAAGIAVMFLLFGATGGGGALLEERESQTLDRLLTTRLSMDELLLGKWFYLTTVGVIQVSIMFVWGQLAFGIDLLRHLDGFLMMTIVTASAAAAFGLCLAALCKTRGQLNGLSVIVVLAMSALGGSMVPRYVMSERMREAGLWTFNAWALDGYDKVFWRDLPVSELWPQLTVLMLSGAGFLVVARLLAVRWETN